MLPHVVFKKKVEFNQLHVAGEANFGSAQGFEGELNQWALKRKRRFTTENESSHQPNGSFGKRVSMGSASWN